MDRREFTQSIVNNLKQKITEFRGRKKKEQMERRNELDFEINKDLVNKGDMKGILSRFNNPCSYKIFFFKSSYNLTILTISFAFL